MNAPMILSELKKIELYSSDEWEEYLSYFSIKNTEINSNINFPDSFLARILSRHGAKPAAVDYSISSKITSPEKLANTNFKISGVTGVVSGCYDLFHLGHARSIAYARQYLQHYDNPKLVTLVLSDENISIKKGDSRPVLNINERLDLLCSVNSVDYAIPLKFPNCLDALEKLKPNYFFKGNADRTQDIVRQEMELVESYGGTVVIFPSTPGKKKSTTGLINEALEKLMREF